MPSETKSVALHLVRAPGIPVTGGCRCEGRKAVPEAVVVEARRLARKSPKTGKRRSLRSIAAELAMLGHFGPAGQPYQASSIR
jgi:hypothetical protein